MPRLYLTPSELNETPLGVGLASSISNLSANVVDKLLARASQRCDKECKRRLQAPGSTTLSQNASPGATQIAVSSTLTLDQMDEQAVQIGNPSNQETVLVQPGGVTVTNWASPYPGTINLASGLVNAHSSTEPVVFLYKETTEAGGVSNSDTYVQAIISQEAEIAYAHMPPVMQGSLTRVVFLRNYPIININQIEHAFSFSSDFNTVSTTIEVPVPHAGWYRFQPASVIMREGLMRTTYTAGFQSIPEDIKEATSLFFAVAMRLMVNPYGAIELHLGKRRQKWAAKGGEPDPLVEEACALLKKYKRSV